MALTEVPADDDSYSCADIGTASTDESVAGVDGPTDILGDCVSATVQPRSIPAMGAFCYGYTHTHIEYTQNCIYCNGHKHVDVQ